MTDRPADPAQEASVANTSAGRPVRPMPRPISLTEPFWAAARAGRLDIQRCRTCGYYNQPPLPQCPQCRGRDLAWVPVSGRGTIYGFTIMHLPLVVGFEDCLPYNCVAVELVEQSGLLLAANLADVRPSLDLVGAPAEVIFEDLPRGWRLPQFRLCGGNA